MAGGLLAVNSDDGVQPATGTLYMPPRSGYGGTMNFSGGTITLSQEDWSAAGHDILAQSWFNDLSGGATVTWDGSVTTISASIIIGAVTNLNDPMEVLEADVDGSAVQFEVVLDGDPPVPTGDTITVVVDPNENGDGPDPDFILIGAAGDGTVTLTFDDTDWFTPQTVTVKAVDDAIVDSAYAEVKQIALLVSSAQADPDFTGTDFSGAPVSITILDDESPAVTWGPTEDVVITDYQDVTGIGSGEIGIPAQNLDYATLTINNGGTLVGTRLYHGFVSNHTDVTVNDGGSLICSELGQVGYDYDVTMTQNGGLVQFDTWMGIGRSGSGTYNMAGGLLALNSDDSVPAATGVLYMPPVSTYGGTINYSGGTIEIHQQDWSASGHDILAQSWFNDLTGGAFVTWNGLVTRVFPGLTITESGGTEVEEGGASDTYQIKLGVEPSADVTITAAPDDSEIDLGSGAGNSIQLTFTTTSWDTAQTVTVSAVDDTVYEGGPSGTPHITTISHSTQQTGGGGEFDGFTVAVEVSVIDDDLICGDWGYMVEDLNKDCYVDLADFAFFSQEWLEMQFPAAATSASSISIPDEIPGLVEHTLQEIDTTEIMDQTTSPKSRAATGPSPPSRRPLQVTLKIDGISRKLKLEPYSVRAEDFRLLVQGQDGQLIEVQSPPACTYRGTVDGDPDSRVAASFINGKLKAEIVSGSEDFWYAQPLSDLMPAYKRSSSHVVYRREDVVSTEVYCGVDGTAPLLADQVMDNADAESEFLIAAASASKVCEIAIDADYEYYQINGSSVSDTMRDIETIMNAVSYIYEKDVDITYSITRIIVRSNISDPYTGSVASLGEFQGHWNSNHSDIQRDTAHLFTGKSLSGAIGVAYVGVICDIGSAYGVSQARYTTDLPNRIAVVAHEIGHNFSGYHCDGVGDCSIMCSIISACTGDVSKFGLENISTITSFSNGSGCLSDFDFATITETAGFTEVAELGPMSDAYSIVLNAAPSANVVVTTDPDIETELNSNGADNSIQLTFTPSNWDVPQTITVTAIDDNDSEGFHTSAITHSFASSDSFYDGMVKYLIVNVLDNDAAYGGTWTGAIDANWNNNGNWSVDPTNNWARIESPVNSPIIGATDTIDRFNIEGGSTLNIGSGVNLTVTGNGTNYVGEAFSGGAGTLNVSETGLINFTGDGGIALGSIGDSVGIINLSDNASVNPDEMVIGLRGNGTLSISDSASITTGNFQFGFDLWLGYAPDCTMTMSGGTVTCSGNLNATAFAGSVNIGMSNGTLNVSGITWNAPLGSFDFSGGQIILDGYQIGFDAANDWFIVTGSKADLYSETYDIDTDRTFLRIPILVADINWDGNVDLTDLTQFIEVFLECTDPIGQDCQQYWNEPAMAVYLKLDETSDTVAFDSSIYGKDGTLVNMEDGDWVAVGERPGNALDFDGVDDFVEIVGYEGITGSVARTVAAWIKTTTTGEIVSWGTAAAGEKWIVRVQDDIGIAGAIRAEVGSGYVVGSTDLRDGGWHHVAAALAAGDTDILDVKLYVDGQAETISDSNGPQQINTTSGADVKIGVFSTSAKYFTGQIDDVRIYNRALSAAEIQELAN
jgi:hypothetical protein